MPKVIVLGSSNTDMILRATKLPRPGQTILGQDLIVLGGGKGANQAVAAARAGSSVHFVGAVGGDSFGRERLAELQAEGIHTDHVQVIDQTPSGVALIFVDDSAENFIGVSPGANGRVKPDYIASLPDALFCAGDILVTQLETPNETVLAMLLRAKGAGVTTILNPAPSQADAASEEWLESIDVLVANEHELAEITGSQETANNPEALRSQVGRLHERGAKSVLVTLGEQGHATSTPEGVHLFPAYAVNAIDTVAAGDTFVGYLACALSNGEGLERAARFASAASALAVTRSGAQASIPLRAEVETFLLEREPSK